MIVEIKSQEKFDNAICVLDNYYRISVYIKVDAAKGEEVVVSYTMRNDEKVIRMISARKAEKLERDEYYGYY